ncbi:hypothetical protein, partial [Shigella flexneri]|uniref:hypothetical protein n=1 Tax=Shigella flexneri TaxID=623 RepID=UPI003CF93659
ADRNRSHWSTSKTPSYTKSVSWQHHRATGYHFHLARIARNHVIRGLYLRDITLQVSPFLASILERDQY